MLEVGTARCAVRAAPSGARLDAEQELFREQRLGDSVQLHMRHKLLKPTAVLGGTAALVLLCCFGVKAQQNDQSSKPSLTTNWMGCLVIGSDESIDSIARGQHPTTQPQIEIGLRSDGVVIWRRTALATTR